jgi:prepilin peptidase
MVLKMMGMLILGIASVSDIRTGRVSLWMVLLAGVCSGLSAVIGITDRMTTVPELLSAMIPGAILLWIGFISANAIGYGDGLMMFMVGPLFGVERMVEGMLLAFFVSAIVSILLIVLRKVNRKTTIPFIPFLASALGVVNFVL